MQPRRGPSQPTMQAMATKCSLWLVFLLLLLLLPPQSTAKYSIQEVTFAADETGPGVTVQVLKNSETGESAQVMQTWGGKLERLSLCPRDGAAMSCSGSPRDVVASRCDSLSSCNASTLRSDRSLGALLIPFANRIAHGRYSFGGEEHLLSADNSTVSHGFLIQGRAMVALSQQADASSAALVLGVVFNGTDAGYPFHIAVNVSYTLSRSGLAVKVRARNIALDGRAAPFMAGMHPYFKLMNSDFNTAKLVLDQCTQWNRQAQDGALQVPNGLASLFHDFNGTGTLSDPHSPCGPACGAGASIHWDDGFTPRDPYNPACVEASGGAPLLVMSVHDGPRDRLLLELHGGFQYVQVSCLVHALSSPLLPFSPLRASHPHPHPARACTSPHAEYPPNNKVFKSGPQVYTGNAVGVAVEPMSGQTNCFNNEAGIVVIEAGATWQGEFRFRVGSAPQPAFPYNEEDSHLFHQ